MSPRIDSGTVRQISPSPVAIAYVVEARRFKKSPIAIETVEQIPMARATLVVHGCE
jgi:hypothetical protein